MPVTMKVMVFLGVRYVWEETAACLILMLERTGSSETSVTRPRRHITQHNICYISGHIHAQ
jgi:hypothetical protein